MRQAYRSASRKWNVTWNGREYSPENFEAGTPVNQALSAGNACLYGIAHAVIFAMGCSPGLGFVHVGHENSFVYDIADLYKTEIVIPLAFELAAIGAEDLPGEMRRRIDDAMKMTGIYELRQRPPHNLSGGQKQRVAIAGVVAMSPDCIVLDEATAMLDPRGREQVMQTIHRLNRDMGITVVAITHYMEEAAQADRVVVMSRGRIVMEGTPTEVFSRTEEVRALHLDVPQAAELRDELVKAGIPMPEGIIDPGACAQALYELLK